MTDREAVERAIQLLDVAAEHIQEHSPTQTTFYDDAECDGICLASECSTMATDLAAISAMGAPRAKPLEWWTPSSENNWVHGAKTIFGTYYVHQCGGRCNAWIELFHECGEIEQWDGETRGSVESAMRDAQSHHEARILSALEPAPVRGWQPIETAPKDETDILIATNNYAGGVVMAYWGPMAEAFIDMDGDTYENATHWMPLPTPPEDAT